MLRVSVLRILDVYSGSWFVPGSRIQQQQKEEGENFCRLTLLYFWTSTEKNLSQLTKNWSIFAPKNLLLSSQKCGLGIRDPGSGIQDPGSRIRKKLDPGTNKHRNLDPDPQHCRVYGIYLHAHTCTQACIRACVPRIRVCLSTYLRTLCAWGVQMGVVNAAWINPA